MRFQEEGVRGYQFLTASRNPKIDQNWDTTNRNHACLLMNRGIAAVREGGLAEDTSCSFREVPRANDLELEGSWAPLPECLELSRMRSA